MSVSFFRKIAMRDNLICYHVLHRQHVVDEIFIPNLAKTSLV